VNKPSPVRPRLALLVDFSCAQAKDWKTGPQLSGYQPPSLVAYSRESMQPEEMAEFELKFAAIFFLKQKPEILHVICCCVMFIFSELFKACT